MRAESEPLWLDTHQVLYLHELAIATHGGLSGVRDTNGLESAVFRPQQLYAYEAEQDRSVLAALYAHGIMANHPFNDGNKRTGFSAADLFLFVNGWDLRPTDDSEPRITFFEKVASGEVSREELAQFYRDNTVRRDSQGK